MALSTAAEHDIVYYTEDAAQLLVLLAVAVGTAVVGR